MFYDLYLKALYSLELKAVMIHSADLAKGKVLNEHKTKAFKNSKDCCLNSDHHPPFTLGQQIPCNKKSFTKYILRDIKT